MKTAFSVNELIQELGIGRTKLYREISAGKLPARKLGKKTVFLREDVQRYLNELPAFRIEGGAR